MTADALTKIMSSPCMMKWLTTGCIDFWNTGHPLEMKRLPPSNELDEDAKTILDLAEQLQE